VKYYDGLLSLHTFTYDNLDYRYLPANSLRIYEDLISNSNFQGSPDCVYESIRKSGEPEFDHERGNYAMWLIPDPGGNPEQYSSNAALTVVVIEALKTR